MFLKQEVLVGKIALERGILTRQQLTECLAWKTKSEPDKPLISILIEREFVDDESLEVILAEQRKILEREERQRRKKIKLRGVQAEEKNSTVSFRQRCRHCDEILPKAAERCMYCGGRLQKGPATRKLEKRRQKSDERCSLCYYPVLDSDESCPACHAVFVLSGDEGEFKCSACGRFVGLEDRECPWCEASFS
ncbi:MAG: hypothetical protein QF752_12065 [Planctomycetota bacterium]|jgi:hypothetical protein|nr:hypothetical protein [Planctomycetota bacterium]